MEANVSEKSEPEYPNGFTLSIFLPGEATTEQITQVQDRVSALVYGEILEDRQGWDPFIVGHGGDILQIEHDCECCPPHIYFSTSCFHGDHNYCKRETGLLGNKIPGVCKFCQAPCVCRCHQEEETENDSVDG